MRYVRFLLALAALALASTLSFRAQAKRTGMNLPCHNCHEGQTRPKITASLSANRVEAGQPVTITIAVAHATAKVGGVLVDSLEVGAFQMIDPVGTQLFDGKPTLATHAMPQVYQNGQVQFSFNWIAPAMVGVANFDIWSNAGNDNKDPHDDHAAGAKAAVSVGCDALWYYTDADLDGAGAEATRAYSCEPLADRITRGGDCDDKNPLANTSVQEVCNSVDDDCDGEIDDGFTPQLLVEDADGDGFGARSGMTKIGCPPEAGFALTFDDCNDADPTVNPGATELSNLRDDDCDGRVDEASGVAGSGSMAPAAPTPAPPGPDGGCQLGSTRSGFLSVILACLLLAFGRRLVRVQAWSRPR